MAIVLLFFVAAVSLGSNDYDANPWIDHSGPTIYLGVSQRSYIGGEDVEMTFVVIQPKYGAIRRTVHGNTNEGLGLYFPEDFPGGIAPLQGLYRWRCEVNGRTILKGSFRLRSRADGIEAIAYKKSR